MCSRSRDLTPWPRRRRFGPGRFPDRPREIRPIKPLTSPLVETFDGEEADQNQRPTVTLHEILQVPRVQASYSSPWSPLITMCAAPK